MPSAEWPFSVNSTISLSRAVNSPSPKLWKCRAPIGWSGLIVSASLASGPLERCFPARADDTPFNDGFKRQMGGRKALETYVARSIPMGRWGQPEEIASGIVFLASDQSSFMTGQALVIDGAECL